MISKKLSMLVFPTLFFAVSCKEIPDNKANDKTNTSLNFEKEKNSILETLNNETKAAFQRDFESWKKNWVHDSTITKTYMNFPERSFTESIGWNEINNFVKTFIEKHPEPEPLPSLIDDIDVRLYGIGAWVSFEQRDSLRGLKRETRLMEKKNGQWKIAGMHTTIYGFEKED